MGHQIHTRKSADKVPFLSKYVTHPSTTDRQPDIRTQKNRMHGITAACGPVKLYS